MKTFEDKSLDFLDKYATPSEHDERDLEDIRRCEKENKCMFAHHTKVAECGGKFALRSIFGNQLQVIMCTKHYAWHLKAMCLWKDSGEDTIIEDILYRPEEENNKKFLELYGYDHINSNTCLGFIAPRNKTADVISLSDSEIFEKFEKAVNGYE